MGAIDRSQEFLTFLQTENASTSSAGASHHHQAKAGGDAAEFSQLADATSVAFDGISAELETLRQLSKRSTLFDDRSSEVQELTFKLKQSLTSLNSNVDSLEEISKRAQYSHGSSPASKHAAAHRHAIATFLRTRLMDATKSFKDILELRTNNLKQLEDRRGLYGRNGTGSNMLRRGPTSSSSLLRRGAPHPHDTGDRPESTGPSFDLEAQQPLSLLAPSTTYHQSRVEAVEQIQRMIGEVSSMFSRVATMVGQQEELVMRIDSTVDESLNRLKEGQAHLLRYFQSITSHRGLILKLLGLILGFAAFFIIFLA